MAVVPKRRQARLSADQKTILLSLTLGLVGVALLWRLRGHDALVALNLPTAVVTVAIAVLFLIGERVMINVEFRRQAYSFTLSGVPLALGLMLLPPHIFVAARILGSALAFLWQRIQPVKAFYNLAAYGFEAALTATAAAAFIGFHRHIGPLAAVEFGAILIVGDALMTVFVLGLIRMHNGRMTRAESLGVMYEAIGLSVTTSSLAMIALLLVDEGVLGAGLMVILVATLIAGYRGYAAMTRRHMSLALVHEFVTGGAGADSVEALGEQLLTRIRTLLRGESAELVIIADNEDPSAAVVLSIGEDDRLHVSNGVLDRTDWLVSRVVSQNESMIASRNTRDPGLRRWLDDHGYRDAIVVPLTMSDELTGVLTIADRLGETTTFVEDDLTMLQTLSGHLAVAIRTARLVERLGYEATHDALTGLANRSFLAQRIREALAAPNAAEVVVLLLDLNSFKEVNDALGHHVGDLLLGVVAERLVDCLPANATIARLGGDEFAVFIPDLDGGLDQARAVAEQISDVLAQPAQFDEAVLTPDASIGIALGSSTERTADLLRQADTAMYEAKTNGQRVAVYTPDLDRGRTERLALLADLRYALDNAPEQLVLYYQPKIDLATSQVVGVEALVRWNHPTLGILGPGSFVPIAESTGLIERLTPHVIEQALTDCHSWIARGYDITVAVNASARNLEDRQLPERVRRALIKADVPARNLVVEITESSVMGDPKQTEPIMHELAALGLSLSLDDFGTGYSSLSYLQRLPVHEIKIDQSFVRGLSGETAENSEALIRSITGLGANLGLHIVAEGVEHAELLGQLRDLGAHVAQGYHISRPLPLDRLFLWLDHERATNPPRLQLVDPDAAAKDHRGRRTGS